MKRNNNIKTVSSATRREFLRRTAAASALGVAGPMALQFSAFSNALAQEADDYKALVCVFLFGGNDNFNTVVPYDDTSYNFYEKIRGSIATPRSQLDSTRLDPTVPLAEGYEYALAPQMPNVLRMWQQGRAGIQLNVGTLMEPTNVTQFKNGTTEIPPNIFAHNLQQNFWQRLSDAGANSGWGGRLVDRVVSAEDVSPFNSISLNGNNLMMGGKTTVATNVTPTGNSLLHARRLDLFGSAEISAAAEKLMSKNYDNLYMDSHSSIVRRSFEANELLNNAFATAAPLQTQFTSVEQSTLSAQLDKVAQIISVRQQLGVKRQVFFVGLSGFDSHSKLNNSHPALLSELDTALQEFYDATVELGVSDRVTTFTGSDFGRSLTNNGDGSDHGWGGHQIIMGDAVSGGRFYGIPPDITDSTAQMLGGRRLIPTTAIEQMGAEMADWFGASTTDLSDVFPRLDRFDTTPLGYFA